MTIKKIPLDEFIQLLDSLYEIGVDFVDINIEPENSQDSFSVSFIKEYVDEEFRDNFEEDKTIPLDLNNNLNDLV